MATTKVFILYTKKQKALSLHKNHEEVCLWYSWAPKNLNLLGLGLGLELELELTKEREKDDDDDDDEGLVLFLVTWKITFWDIRRGLEASKEGLEPKAIEFEGNLLELGLNLSGYDGQLLEFDDDDDDDDDDDLRRRLLSTTFSEEMSSVWSLMQAHKSNVVKKAEERLEQSQEAARSSFL